METIMKIVPILALAVAILSAIYAKRAVTQNRKRNEEAQREWQEDRRERRISNTVNLYMQLFNSRKDSRLSAFLQSNIGGLPSNELEDAAERIRKSTGEDPLSTTQDGPIRDVLERNDIDLRIFLDHVIEGHYNPHTNWGLDKIITEITRKQR